MDWLTFLRERIGPSPMPMAEHFSFELLEVRRGIVRARALPRSAHYNPLGVVQGGFAGTVLDIAMGLAGISVLPEDAAGVSTMDLNVTYLRPILESAGWMNVCASIVHAGSLAIVSEATLEDERGRIHAIARSSSIVLRARCST